MKKLTAKTAHTKPTNGLAAWTQLLDQHPAETKTKTTADRQLVLLLQGDFNAEEAEGSPQTLMICPAWVRTENGKVKTAGARNPLPVVLDETNGPQPAPPGGWSIEIATALVLLLQNQETASSGLPWATIQAHLQEQAMLTLLATYPAYYEQSSQPLTLGADLPIKLQWKDFSDGSQQLSASVGPEETSHIFRAARLWYVLPKKRLFGAVIAQEQTTAILKQAMVVQPEQSGALRKLLSQGSKGSKSELPLPTARDTAKVITKKPKPVMTIRMTEVRLRKNAKPFDLGCAQVAFDYAGVLVFSQSKPLVQRHLYKGAFLEIHRQKPEETQYIKLLKKLGFVTPGDRSFSSADTLHPPQMDELLLWPRGQVKPLPPEDWQPIIEQLTRQGFRIEYTDDFPHQQMTKVQDWHIETKSSGSNWFEVSLGIDVGEDRVDLLPILRRTLADSSFSLAPKKGEKPDAVWRVKIDENRSADLPLSRLRAMIEPLLEWIQGDGALRVHQSRAEMLGSIASEGQLHWSGGEKVRAKLEQLRKMPSTAAPPPDFRATLRPYQGEGLAWLNFLGDIGLGGILADDMGLGKTVQVLAHILSEKDRGRLKEPALIVAPTSLVGNWNDESARFAPTLKVLVLHGAQRFEHFGTLANYDVVITTYPLIPRDVAQLGKAHFALLILDEAQAIKNPRSLAARAVRAIPATRRLAMTGTPLENHLGELWAQFDAVEPGLLGSEKQFTKVYRTPIEKHGDTDLQKRLNRRIALLLLRRRKQDVLNDLPAKTEIVHTLELKDEQRALYETLRLAQHERVQQAVQQRGLSQSGIIVIDALLKLRQACCDPRLVKLASAQKIEQSAKLEALLELLDTLVSEGRRVLIFSQFTEMLALIEDALKKRHIAYLILTGQTPPRERGNLVKTFQTGDAPVFLISLKAGGVGLNLTAADTVIHYDPWWNPAVEAQATDRAHRIGQDKPVFVYRLICQGTVEEKIQALQLRKASLAQAVLEGDGAGRILRFDEKDLADLFAPM